MRSPSRMVASAVVSAAMVCSSTSAVAAPAVPATPSSPWVTLSMLNPAGAAALGGTAGAQPADYVPGEATDDGRGFHPPLPVIAVFLAVIALNIWIFTRKNHGRGHVDVDVISPG
jgi:hypothetical protein